MAAARALARRTPKRRTSKYGVYIDKVGITERTYKGVKFDSKLELAYFKHLEMLVRAGEVKKVEVKPRRFKLVVNGKLVSVFTPDFFVEYSDGSYVYAETKGKVTEAFTLRRKLWAALYPEEAPRLKIIKREDF